MRANVRVGIVMALAAALIGCAEKKRGSSSSGGSDAPRIVFITNGNSPFFDATEQGMKEAGQEFGVEVDMQRNDRDVEGQIERLNQVLSQPRVKGVAISIVNAEAQGIVDKLKKLREQGVHVVTFDSDTAPAQRSAREAYIGTNNINAGRAAGRAAKALLPQGGGVVAFVGKPTADNAKQRIQGFQEAAGPAFPWLDLLEDGIDRNRALTNVNTAIENQKTAKLLLGVYSYNGPAIADAVNQRGLRARYTIVAFDAEPTTLQALDKGLIDATVVQHPYEFGYQGVKLLKALIQDDRKTVDAMLKGGDTLDTGVVTVVPAESSPILKGGAPAADVQTYKVFWEALRKKGLSSS